MRAKLHPLLLTWEIYPIIFVAGFLRLYRLDTTAFAGDQSVLFSLAHDAVRYALIPATSNGSSLSTMHPPLAIYFLMIPALLSPDPLWAAIMTALFNVFAVLLTYIFTRRYYGRLAAAIAALLYATAETTIVFSRFIWQPTLLAPFVVLFLFALFWGVVERRKGWLFPALLLLGVMFQLHEITLLLVMPLLVALLLAPRTILLRDIVLAVVFLLLIFAPYLVWEVTSKFADIHTFFGVASSYPRIDTEALTFYGRFLNSYYYDERFLGSSYYDPLGSSSSLVFMLLPLLTWSRQILLVLLSGGFAIAGAFVLRARSREGQTETSLTKQPATSLLFARLRGWWTSLRADPSRRGLVVLLAWQLVPLLMLSRHTAPLHQHYLLLTIPGPFILIGFFISRVILWFQAREPVSIWRRMRYATYALTALVLSVQLVGSTASLIDTGNGINSHLAGYNELGSLQHAANEADRVAQEHHLNRVYMTFSAKDDALTSLPFLAEQLRTPTTLFDAASCLVLPAPSQGPAVLLMRSSDRVVSALLSRFATATLIDQPPLPGTFPFQLYIVTSDVQLTPVRKEFVHHLQLLDSQARQLYMDGAPLLVTRWNMLRSEPPVPQIDYTYRMKVKTDLPGAENIQGSCMLTSIRAGDLLITAFPLPRGSTVSSSFRITSQFLVMSLYTISLGPLHFETAYMQETLLKLHAVDGGDAITITREQGDTSAGSYVTIT